MANKDYSKAPFVLFLIAAIIAILRGLFSINLFIFSRYIPEFNQVYASLGKSVYYGIVFSIIGLILGIVLLITSFKTREKYDSKAFYIFGWLLAGIILAEFYIEAVLILIGFLIGIIKQEPWKESTIIISKFAIILGVVSTIATFIRYFVYRELIGTLSLGLLKNFFLYFTIVSIILGLIVLIISIILYPKIKNRPSKDIFVLSLILGIVGFFSSASYGAILLIITGIIGLRAFSKDYKS